MFCGYGWVGRTCFLSRTVRERGGGVTCHHHKLPSQRLLAPFWPLIPTSGDACSRGNGHHVPTLTADQHRQRRFCRHHSIPGTQGLEGDMRSSVGAVEDR